MNRRRFAQMTAAIGLGRLLATHEAEAGETPPPAHDHASMHASDPMARYAGLMAGDKLSIGMLLYPGMFLQDLVGPLTVFEALMNRDIHLLWKNREPVGDGKVLIPVRPTTSFADCPEVLDVLFVPGGVPGTYAMMEDPEVLAFLAARGKRARYVTSVCTGSLILAAAGLLEGYRATSHWATHDVLKTLGAVPVRKRVVIDRNRITGGGVTAGIDFGLTLTSLLRSPDYAKAVQLYLEYDPAPPFNSGSPDKAPRLVKRFLDEMFASNRQTAFEVAARARRALGGRT